jgi:hypothetical protein
MKLKELVDEISEQKEKEELDRKAVGCKIFDTVIYHWSSMNLF